MVLKFTSWRRCQGVFLYGGDADLKKLIKNGYVIDPYNGYEGISHIVIEYGKIKELLQTLENIDENDFEVLDAKGLIVAPGFIDLHVHLREPGFEYKETLYTGSRACAKGGYTTVACMPNTNPAMDTAERVKLLKETIERDSCIEVLPVGAITLGIQGKELANHEKLFIEGVIGLSDDGRTTMDSEFMKQAFLNAKKFNKPVMTHSEDHLITQSHKDTIYPIQAETNIVLRDIQLCHETGGHLHVGHVSGMEAIEAIRTAKKQGIHVTCEAAPHHFALNDERVNTLDPYAKVNPPIRSEVHRRAVIQGLMDNTIDVIATDHAPHDAKSKEGPYENAAYGISGIETAFQVAYSVLVLEEGLSLFKLISKMTAVPAQIAGLKDVGHLSKGANANVVLLDLDCENVIDTTQFISKGKNSPFQGKKYKGEVVETLYKGESVYKRT